MSLFLRLQVITKHDNINIICGWIIFSDIINDDLFKDIGLYFKCIEYI